MDASQTHKLNIPILSKELAHEAWFNTFWSKFAGFMDYTETNGIKQHTPAANSIIQVMKDFISEGRDNMIMPMLLPLEEPGVYGDSRLKGTGEDLRLKYLQIYINQWRKAVTAKSGAMANQRLSMLQLTEKAKPELVKWWSKAYNQAIWQTFYEGVSPHLSAGTNDDGLGLSVRFHPNWYYEDTATTGGLLTSVGTAKYTKTVANITTDVTSAKVEAINVGTFLAAVELITTELLIEPIVHEGSDPFWLWMCSPKTFTAIKKNSTIVGQQNAAYNAKLMSHPAINGKQMLYYEGFCIIPDPVGIRGLKTASTDPVLDLAGGDLRSGWLKPQPAAYNVIQNSLIIGANALGKGIASTLKFTNEDDDHENVKEIGSNCIEGYNRADYFSETDSGTSAAFTKNNATKTVLATAYEALNQSSLIISTED